MRLDIGELAERDREVGHRLGDQPVAAEGRPDRPAPRCRACGPLRAPYRAGNGPPDDNAARLWAVSGCSSGPARRATHFMELRMRHSSLSPRFARIAALVFAGCFASACAAQQVDLIVGGDYVVTMDARQAGGQRRCGRDRERRHHRSRPAPRRSPAKYRAKRTLAGQRSRRLPGLINGHTHAAMTLLRGMADDHRADRLAATTISSPPKCVSSTRSSCASAPSSPAAR